LILQAAVSKQLHVQSTGKSKKGKNVAKIKKTLKM